ncbi:hypothetical protein [Streptomyces spiralis]|nr:hypothetical protein [Streptomyces spiralis]
MDAAPCSTSARALPAAGFQDEARDAFTQCLALGANPDADLDTTPDAG